MDTSKFVVLFSSQADATEILDAISTDFTGSDVTILENEPGQNVEAEGTMETPPAAPGGVTTGGTPQVGVINNPLKPFGNLDLEDEERDYFKQGLAGGNTVAIVEVDSDDASRMHALLEDTSARYVQTD